MYHINKELLQTLRTEITLALLDVAKRHNVTLRPMNASYAADGCSASFKLEVTALGEGGAQRDVPAELFIKSAVMIGLQPSDLGKPLHIQGRNFTVAGYKPKARKNCILIKDTANGKTFVTDVATVKRQLASK